ncbi:MATE family efflux transporter [Emcibacter nanhaiensis]|uniref:MATE family efflux transporter n=1 Tax=Emcibacter nanhaiensis TaxID=1505037 RepID=A0A501PIC2_9PROT|nr:MATE family efflux transporter [Emcibacter nanhaiensis]TPD59751.1 MATE family efflux transporter [Emcibacter nanhaiensis]
MKKLTPANDAVPPQDRALSREMWAIAVPSILANISIPLLGLADSFIMGHLEGPEYLAALALGAMIFSVLYNGFNFLRMATTGFAAQAYGREDARESSVVLFRATFLALVIGALLILASPLITSLSFQLTAAEAHVEDLADSYFNLRIFGAPFALFNFVAVGWLLGMHRAGDALLVQIFMNVTNIALNIYLVYGLGMDVDGVGLGTALAEFLAAFLSVFLIYRQYRRYFGRSPFRRSALAEILNSDGLTRLLKLNLDIFIRTLCLMAAMASFTILGSRYGSAILAANAILMELQMLTSYGLDGFAQAAEILVGKATGRKNPNALRRAALVSGKFALYAALAYALLYALLGSGIVALLTDLDTIRLEARHYLWWLILLPLFSVWSFLFDGIFIGATAGAHMRNGMILSVLFYALCLAITLPLWENHGLWFSYTAFMVMRALTLIRHYPDIEKAASRGGLSS